MSALSPEQLGAMELYASIIDGRLLENGHNAAAAIRMLVARVRELESAASTRCARCDHCGAPAVYRTGGLYCGTGCAPHEAVAIAPADGTRGTP